jgi:hydrogenase expression/formation protein HypC
MCLAIPVRILELKGDMAVGEVGGVERDVSVVMTPGVKVGDYVIVHAGFAIQVVDQQEAKENLRFLRELARSTEEQVRRVRERRGRASGRKESG